MPHRPCFKSMEDAFRFYYRPLCLYALHYLNNTEDAEDTVQDCFAALWEHINNGRMVSDLKSYLYSMTRNHCILPIGKRTSGETACIHSTKCISTPCHQNFINI